MEKIALRIAWPTTPGSEDHTVIDHPLQRSPQRALNVRPITAFVRFSDCDDLRERHGVVATAKSIEQVALQAARSS
jgi:hypothetical protein